MGTVSESIAKTETQTYTNQREQYSSIPFYYNNHLARKSLAIGVHLRLKS